MYKECKNPQPHNSHLFTHQMHLKFHQASHLGSQSEGKNCFPKIISQICICFCALHFFKQCFMLEFWL